jgi:hypothetical protein
MFNLLNNFTKAKGAKGGYPWGSAGERVAPCRFMPPYFHESRWKQQQVQFLGNLWLFNSAFQ